MKGFTSRPIQIVTLRRTLEDDSVQEVCFEVAPSPIGFSELLDRAFPAPLTYVNGKPESLDPAKASEHFLDKQLLLLGKSLGKQLETPFPTDLTQANLVSYLKSLKAELEAACLTTGDINQILAGLQAANKGLGKVKLGNG